MTEADKVDHFLERAAIMEYDAGMERREAERRAKLDVWGKGKIRHNDLLPGWLQGWEDE